MDVYQELLLQLLKENKLPIPQKEWDTAIDRRCYWALKKIKAVVQDDSLSDPECFYKIEEILTLFDELGIETGTRHDFG